LEAKILLRLSQLPKKQTVNILDCFSASGKLWREVQKRTKKQLIVTRIETKKNKGGVYLEGDNRKYLKSLTLTPYDMIDLDAFGVPFEQLEIIWSKIHTRQTIVITFIQSGFGMLPPAMLRELGITQRMFDKCRTLFCKNGFETLKAYLSLHGVDKIKVYRFHKKIYASFNTVR
jgi:hypothetical protein